MSALACGIDFGTSNSLSAVKTPDGVTVCEVDPPNADPQLLPSLLYFHRYGWNRVGREAAKAYHADPEYGRFIRALKSALPDYDAEEIFRIWRVPYTLPRLLGLVFHRLKQCVEEFVGGTVDHVTVGRPVRFSPDPTVDRRAEGMLRAAAENAGFVSVRFLTEPEAATRYYFSTQDGRQPDETVLVFDLGGGTLDLCLARFSSSGYRVLATGGAHIGGTLLDRVLFEKKLLKHLGEGRKWGRGLELPYYLFNRLVNPDAAWRVPESEYAREVAMILHASVLGGTYAPELRVLQTVVSRRLGPELFAEIEAAKVRLSTQEETEIRFRSEGIEIVEPLSRAELRVLFQEQLQAIRELIHDTLRHGGRRPGQVDRVLLAGGSSALVCTQELLRELFGEARVPLRQDLFTSIVRGLALDAAGERGAGAGNPTLASDRTGTV